MDSIAKTKKFRFSGTVANFLRLLRTFLNSTDIFTKTGITCIQKMSIDVFLKKLGLNDFKKSDAKDVGVHK